MGVVKAFAHAQWSMVPYRFHSSGYATDCDYELRAACIYESGYRAYQWNKRIDYRATTYTGLETD